MKKERGFTIFEVITVMVLASTLMSISVVNLKKFNRPSDNAAAHIRSFVKEVRVRALANTAAYRITAATEDKLVVSYADKCTSATFTNEPRVHLKMPTGAKMVETGWTICINARGLANANQSVSVEGNDGSLQRVEIMLGGATRLL